MSTTTTTLEDTDGLRPGARGPEVAELQARLASQPASHGCVRVTYAAVDHIWDAGLIPIGTPVWVR